MIEISSSSRAIHAHVRVGSWEGSIRIWKLDSKLKSFALVGAIPALGVVNSLQIVSIPKRGFDKVSWVQLDPNPTDSSNHPANGVNEASDKPRHHGSNVGPLLLVAAVGQEMKFGRWLRLKGDGVVNCALAVALHPRTLA